MSMSRFGLWWRSLVRSRGACSVLPLSEDDDPTRTRDRLALRLLGRDEAEAAARVEGEGVGVGVAHVPYGRLIAGERCCEEAPGAVSVEIRPGAISSQVPCGPGFRADMPGQLVHLSAQGSLNPAGSARRCRPRVDRRARTR